MPHRLRAISHQGHGDQEVSRANAPVNLNKSFIEGNKSLNVLIF